MNQSQPSLQKSVTLNMNDADFNVQNLKSDTDMRDSVKIVDSRNSPHKTQASILPKKQTIKALNEELNRSSTLKKGQVDFFMDSQQEVNKAKPTTAQTTGPTRQRTKVMESS